MLHCYCGMCRKAHGSVFATFVAAPAEGFEWLSGAADVVGHQSTPVSMRWFCRHCGSATPEPNQPGPQAWMPAGLLDGDCGPATAHMFTDSRLPWLDVNDGLPAYPAAPPGSPEPPAGAADREVSETTAGSLSGGCLCGRVRYAIQGEPLVMVNCHCSRCRRARGAAHATNLFVRPEQLTWLAGEEAIRVFDLPGAERFGVNFCPTCGGPVPRASAKIGRVNVPAGSLDGDPGVRPAFHIYVGSKAPWFEIRDGLPTHDERAPSP